LVLNGRNKKGNNNYQNGILLSILSGLSSILILYIYSRNTSPENEVFINQPLYIFAVMVLSAFFVCISFMLIGLKKAFFSKGYQELNPSKLIYYVQSPFKNKNYKILFVLVTTVYFLFFGFLSNIFIFFNNDGTVFSVFNRPGQQPHNTSSILNNHQHNAADKNDEGNAVVHTYPKYNLIICCNSLGYVPMIIYSINSNFSFLLIPINFLLGIVISILVGLNVTFNIFLLKQIKSLKLSKRSLFSFFGMSSGLFVGCPTCAGSFFYSLAGFSSIITFSYLSVYQIIFVVTSIPLLIFSIVIMAKVSKKRYIESCNVKK
jgi:hypothetical protein